MSNISLPNLKAIVADAYAVHAEREFGEAGTLAVTRLLDGIAQIFFHCPPDNLAQAIMIVASIEHSAVAPSLLIQGSTKSFHGAREAAVEIQTVARAKQCLVELNGDGKFLVTAIESDTLDIESILDSFIVYRYENETDRIRFRGYNRLIPKVHPSLKSSFAKPSHSGLEEALREYAAVASVSRCPKLAEVWEGGVNGPRLVLANRPESTMRDSLAYALSLWLGAEAAVRPEQNVDESKPVDIRIDWYGSAASALLEIKWLGRSTARKQSEAGSDFTDYAERRAREGSKQLADYLDRNERFDRNVKPIGYHVVFDARRKNVMGPGDSLSAADAFHFEHKEIHYDPDHHEIRDDFAPYVRFFMKPRRSQMLAA